MTESGACYPFIIMNTDRSDKKGTYWWSFLDLHPKKRSFYSIVLALKVLRSLFLKMIRKYLTRYFDGIEKFNKRDNKISLITLKFSM